MGDRSGNTDIVTAEFKRAMRRLASTVTIISTADVNGNRYGMAATAVNSVSMDPPSLLVCINNTASIHAPLAGRGFTVGDWRDDANGIPYLEDAQCNLVVCDVDKVVPVGTHSVVIGRVNAVRASEGIAPLIYADTASWSRRSP
jgi:flavin reductase (DIM6/NTAB) family NADH-FMN oxidoreductase RutF